MDVLDIERGNYPSYTINTLSNIEKKYPKNKFYIVLGQDTFSSLRKWKNYKTILDKYNIFVYPRLGNFRNPFLKRSNIIFLKTAPIIEISSSFIRGSIQKGKNMDPMLNKEVLNYIIKYKFYERK